MLEALPGTRSLIALCARTSRDNMRSRSISVSNRDFATTQELVHGQAIRDGKTNARQELPLPHLLLMLAQPESSYGWPLRCSADGDTAPPPASAPISREWEAVRPTGLPQASGGQAGSLLEWGGVRPRSLYFVEAMVVEQPGSPEELRLKEVPDPTPGPDEVLIEVAYAGVGFVDTLFRAGAFALPLPLIPGIEVAGRVRTAGPGVTRFAPGDRVAALLNDFGRGPRAGGYAELAVAHASMAARVPDGLDLALVAGTAVNGTTAWLALHDLARVGPGDRVGVLGASGGLGSIACRVAAVAPVRQVVGVVGSERTRPLAPPECTDVVLATDFGASVAKLTGGAGLDVTVDPVGGDLRDLAFEHLAPFGRLLLLGDASGDGRCLPGDAIWLGSRQVIGLSLGGVAHLLPDRVSAALESLLELLARGVLREPEPAIRPLRQAPAVHRELEQRTAPPKTVLRIS